MNEELVARIKSLCKEQGTSCTKIETEYGWGNGSIGKWAKLKSLPPHDRLQIVAKRLGVTIDYLLTGENGKKPAHEGELTETQREAIDLIMKMSDEQLKVFVATLKATIRE